MNNLLNVKQRENNQRKLYTGVIEYNIEAINPSHEELKKLLNTENVNAPNYMNNGKLRLDFWLKNNDLNIVTKMSIWLENKDRVAKSGNILFINQKNQTTWASSLEEIQAKPNMAWFDTTTARVCKIDEDKLYDLIVAFINADTNEGGIVLEKFEKLLEGDVTELTELFNHFSANGRTIKLLTGVKNGRQEIYTNYFIRSEIRSNRALMNALDKSPFKADYYSIENATEYTGQKMETNNEVITGEKQSDSSLF